MSEVKKAKKSAFDLQWRLLVKAIGEQHAMQVLEVLGGVTLYIPKSYVRKKKIEAVLSLHASGMSVREIAIKMMWSERYINQIIRDHKKDCDTGSGEVTRDST